MCSVLSAEGKRFVLIFPEGKGVVVCVCVGGGGETFLAQKLRSCGVGPSPCAMKAPLAMIVAAPSNQQVTFWDLMQRW